jgi:cellulose synthase/poly-beta-1,6-N-acetylglucosamine synthase-like glycosyltransferase
VVWVYAGIQKIKTNPSPQNLVFRSYSIIIAAHNEQKIISECLDVLINQDYLKPQYEIIVVADRCEDKTAEIVENYKSQFERLILIKIIDLPNGISPKKNALKKGIEAAEFENLLFIDADVTPTTQLISSINSCFHDQVAVVVGLMKLNFQNSFFHQFLIYERLLNWLVAVAGIGNYNPIIAYGGCWAYTKGAFNRVGGFSNISHSLGGDDDLLLQQFGKANLKVVFCENPDGWVHTDAPVKFSNFLLQRKRHIAAGKYYQAKFKMGYFIFHSSNILLWLLPFVDPWALVFLILKMFFTLGLINQAKDIFRERLSLRLIPLYDFLFVLYNIFLGVTGHLGKKHW